MARMEDRRGTYWVFGGETCGNETTWGDQDADGRTILRWIFRKCEVVETGWSWLRVGTGGGHL